MAQKHMVQKVRFFCIFGDLFYLVVPHSEISKEVAQVTACWVLPECQSGPEGVVLRYSQPEMDLLLCARTLTTGHAVFPIR